MKHIRKFLFLICLISMILSIVSCSMKAGDGEMGYGDGGLFGGVTGAPSSPGGSYDAESPDGMEGAIDGETGDDAVPEEPDTDESKPEENVTLPSGMITAGAWDDNSNYKMWQNLFLQGDPNGKFYDYTIPKNSWGFNSLNRVKVTVTNGEKAVAGATVTASDGQGNMLFSAVTDAKGNAYLFTSESSGNLTIKSGNGNTTAEFTSDNREIAVNLNECGSKLDVIEIMFVVDVTGSMGDEISFLKAELADVISKIAANNSNAAIKLALLFYRDKEDATPFSYHDFTDVTNSIGMFSQLTALNLQHASGGGDYPEAVDAALELAVNKQWSTGATTKLIFHVLDAPAHDGKEYKERFFNATKTAAEKGIRICPIICSGAAEETEYTMREAAIYTGGTFIFVTDDSGIGGSHHDPNLPNVTVELLNSMLVRLVNGYHTGSFADPIYWKEDSNLSSTNK